MEIENTLPFTGERIVTGFNHHVGVTEHLHRYAIALELCKNREVLDIACGEGYGANLISKIASNTFGVDISSEAVTHATEKYGTSKLQFLEGSADKIPLADASVDVVVSFETIEHHNKHNEMFLEIKRVLRENGLLIMSSPEKSIYSERDPHNPYHIKELTLDEFRKLTQKHFKYSNFFSQKYIHGSLIEPLNPTTNAQEFKLFGGNYYNISNSLSQDLNFYNKPYFNLVLASDHNLTFEKTSFFDGADVAEKQKDHYLEEIERILNTSSYKFGNFFISLLKKLPLISKIKNHR